MHKPTSAVNDEMGLGFRVFMVHKNVTVVEFCNDFTKRMMDIFFFVYTLVFVTNSSSFRVSFLSINVST